MNAVNFKYILISLVAVLFFVIVSQVFWLNTLVNNSKQELLRVFSEAVDNTSKKLQRDENLKMIRMNINLSSQDSIQTVIWNEQVKSLTSKKDTNIIKHTDTVLTINNRKISIKKTETFSKKHNRDSGINEMTSVVISSNKVNTRIKNMDTLLKGLVLDYENKDISLKNRVNKNEIYLTLKNELKNKGVEIAFEFAVFEKGKSVDPIIHSDYFNEALPGIKTDLFRQDIYRDGGYLYAYPSEAGFYIFNRLKGVIILSAFFSVVILVLFFITFKAILKQKKLSQIKNDFINNMTHEFKTPLATINLAGDALRNPIIREDVNRHDNYINIIKEESKKIQIFIDKILETALLDHEGIKFHFEQKNLHDLIQKTVNHFNLVLLEKNGHALIHSKLNNNMMMLDPYYFSLAISNIIDNSIKYCIQSPEIKISLDDTLNSTIIKISDNGIGINQEDKKLVFEKFYRSHTGDIHEVKGFGLGLSFSEQIIKAHGGNIKIESEQGKGTSVIITMSNHE